MCSTVGPARLGGRPGSGWAAGAGPAGASGAERTDTVTEARAYQLAALTEDFGLSLEEAGQVGGSLPVRSGCQCHASALCSDSVRDSDSETRSLRLVAAARESAGRRRQCPAGRVSGYCASVGAQ